MVKLWKNKNGQIFLGIPKKIADALGWEHGDIVYLGIEGKDKIKIEKNRKLKKEDIKA